VRVAVIGAGAAGISAARELVARGQDVTVYEARDRVGGRAWSDTSLAPHPVELGAEFVHGERVATWDWLREFGAETTGAAHAYRMWFHFGGKLLDHAATRAELGCEPMFAMQRLSQLWREQGRGEGSLADSLELWPLVSTRPLTSEGRALLANYIAEYVASDFDQVGIPSPAPEGVEPERLINFRILGGYTSLMTRAAAGLEIKLNTVVSRVRWDAAAAEITANGRAARFDAAVVCLPLGVLAHGDVEFDPPLPAPKLEAVRRVNAGHISKIVLVCDRVYWPDDLCFLWTTGTSQVWWRPGQGQPNEAPILTAFFGGSAAAALEAASEAEAIEVATRELGDALGCSLAGHVVGGRYIAWGAEPFTKMGYSSLPPGGEGLREALAAPEPPLFFAGEATNALNPATVHGAIESGRRAAAEVLSAEGRRVTLR
jgi:monoamine oxidase